MILFVSAFVLILFSSVFVLILVLPEGPRVWTVSSLFCSRRAVSRNMALFITSSACLHCPLCHSRRHVAFPPLFNTAPPWFDFLVNFDFFAPLYRRSREASSVKFHKKKIQRRSWSNVNSTEVARLHKVSVPSCTQSRPSPKVPSRSGDYRLDYLHETWHTCSPCLWLQNGASNFIIFA